MPRPKKNPKNEAAPVEVVQGKYWLPSDAPWGGFINVKLDEGQKDQFSTWFGQGEGLHFNMLDDALGDGLKVGFSYDRENECYITTLTGAGWEGCTDRYCLTSRAGTFDESVALSMYKHYIVCAGDWGDLRPRTGRKDSWG